MECFPTVLWNLVYLKESMLSDLLWWPVNNEGLWGANKLIGSEVVHYTHYSDLIPCHVHSQEWKKHKECSIQRKNTKTNSAVSTSVLWISICCTVQVPKQDLQRCPGNEFPPSFPIFPAFSRPCAPKICSLSLWEILNLPREETIPTSTPLIFLSSNTNQDQGGRAFILPETGFERIS